MRVEKLLTVLLIALLAAGCRSRQLARDGIGARQALLRLYTDQLMDNLIRARNHQPFVQMRYYDLLVQETDTVGGGAEVGQSATTGPVGRTIGKVFSVSASGSRVSLTSLKAEPVTDQNDVYQMYRDFAFNPYQFVVSHEPPPCGTHIVRRHSGVYYWVPLEAAPAFAELYLKTTVMRGKEKPSPGYYQVTIADVTDPTEPVPGRDILNATLNFEDPVPFGDATLTVTLADGRRVRLRVFLPDESTLPRGSLTRELRAQWNPTRQNLQPGDLKGRSGNLYSDEFPPEEPSLQPTVQRLLNQVDRIQASQGLPTP